MNICFVEMGYPTKNFGGGAGTYVQLIAKELVKRSHKAFVISKYLDDEPTKFIDEGVVIKRIKIKSWHWYFSKIPAVGKILGRFFGIIESSLALNREINQLHKNYNLDLIEFPETANFLFSLQVKLPYIVHLHGSNFTFQKYCHEEIGLGDRLQRKLEGFFIKRAEVVTAPSQFMKEEIVREFNISVSKIHVIPLPIDERLLNIPINLNKEDKIIFYAGRLEKRKGVHALKEAIPLVIREYPKIKFLLFGNDSKEITKENLLEYFKEHNVADKVEIHHFIPHEELFTYLARADICVVPSFFETASYTVREAMTAGKAVVATNVGGIPDSINDGISGILVKENDPYLLYRAILDLLVDDDKRQRVGQKARNSIVSKANATNIVEKHLEIYHRIIVRVRL